MARTAGSQKASKSSQKPAGAPVEKQTTTPPPAKKARTGVKKYIVQCRYHTSGSLAYRIYASSESDAERIARVRFVQELGHGGRLDGVTAVELPKE